MSADADGFARLRAAIERENRYRLHAAYVEQLGARMASAGDTARRGRFSVHEIARMFRLPLRILVGPVPYKRNARRYGRG